MKKITYVFVLALLTSVSSFAQSQEINWVTFEQAIELQKKNPKKIMMDVYTNWCGPCKMLDKNTFHNKDVVEFVNKNYYAVKFDAEGNSTLNYEGRTFSNPNYKEALKSRRNGVHDLTRYLKVSAYPTIVFFDTNAKVISPIKGYQKPQQLELYLKLFLGDDYASMKTQEDFSAYYSAFKPEFQQ